MIAVNNERFLKTAMEQNISFSLRLITTTVFFNIHKKPKQLYEALSSHNCLGLYLEYFCLSIFLPIIYLVLTVNVNQLIDFHLLHLEHLS